MTDPRLGLRKTGSREMLCDTLFELWASSSEVVWYSEDGRIALRLKRTKWSASVDGRPLDQKTFHQARTAAAAAIKERDRNKGEDRDHYVRHPGHAADRD